MNRRTWRRTWGERQEVEVEIGQKICKFKTNLSYIKKQNETTPTNLKKTKGFVTTKPRGTYCERNDNILLKGFSLELSPGRPV